MRTLLMATTVLLLTIPAALGGQNVAVDEGAFRISLQGEIVGREEFSIQRVGMGTEARVLEPESLKELVKAELHGALSYYKEPIDPLQNQITPNQTADYAS